MPQPNECMFADHEGPDLFSVFLLAACVSAIPEKTSSSVPVQTTTPTTATKPPTASTLSSVSIKTVSECLTKALNAKYSTATSVANSELENLLKKKTLDEVAQIVPNCDVQVLTDGQKTDLLKEVKNVLTGLKKSVEKSTIEKKLNNVRKEIEEIKKDVFNANLIANPSIAGLYRKKAQLRAQQLLEELQKVKNAGNKDVENNLLNSSRLKRNTANFVDQAITGLESLMNEIKELQENACVNPCQATKRPTCFDSSNGCGKSDAASCCGCGCKKVCEPKPSTTTTTVATPETTTVVTQGTTTAKTNECNNKTPKCPDSCSADCPCKSQCQQCDKGANCGCGQSTCKSTSTICKLPEGPIQVHVVQTESSTVAAVPPQKVEQKPSTSAASITTFSALFTVILAFVAL